ncbi:hypothetical protein KR222_009845, partial [Zaprionus bogoriensis]
FYIYYGQVRDQYVKYLERQLKENVSVWASASRNHHKPTALACIEHSVRALETRAIRASQAAQLYQRAMIKMVRSELQSWYITGYNACGFQIAAVRRNTQECRLADALFDRMQRQEEEEEDSASPDVANGLQQFVDKATQTTTTKDLVNGDDYQDYTLCQKIDLFQSRLAQQEEAQEREQQQREQQQQLEQLREQQQQQQEKLSQVAAQPAASPASSTEDAVAQELAKLFDDEPTDLNALFGIEIATSESTALLRDSARLMASPATPPTMRAHNASSNNCDLRQSRWPCELYAQRRRLNACLVQLLDADWRCEDALRYKFHMLFGEDSDDEFATQICSPSIDLVDEVLLASCILRIRPWIVRHLMRPLQEGLIANRFLFKKLAKLLANSIVQLNPYASERQVRLAVEQLFCQQPRGVQCAQDLETLPAVFVERFS